MVTGPQPLTRDGVPSGYVPVPIDMLGSGATASPTRVCVLVKQDADPVAGRFVFVRQNCVARAVLGCLTDAASNVIHWLEIWVQTSPAAATEPHSRKSEPTNAAADARWLELVDAFARLGRTGGFLTSGWERAAGIPLVLDPDLSRIRPLTDPLTRRTWSLCTDEAVLATAGLPGYAGSPHRYLYLAGQTEQGSRGFIPVTVGAPDSVRTMLPAAAGDKCEVFNLSAGRMFIRRHGPMPLPAMLDVLAGRPWRGVGHGTALLLFPEAPDPAEEGRLFMDRHGRRGRVVESFHLRLRLLADMITSVRQCIAVTGRPLLSLAPRSFQLQLPAPSSGLPFLWGAQVTLADCGDALKMTVPGSDMVCFQSPAGAPASICRPRAGSAAVAGECLLRVRQVISETSTGTIIEGTLSTQERVEWADNQLLWVRPILASGPVEIYARLDAAPSVSGEWKFRSVGQRFTDAAMDELKAAEGVPLWGVPFALIPTVTTANDLYALGVLAVQALLADGQASSLPVALDAMLSLARLMAEKHDPAVDLGTRIALAVQADPRWLAALGPHRLLADTITPQAALDLITGELWWDTLAAVVRMFPAEGPDSICPTWADASLAIAPHRVFDKTLADLDSLIRRSRSLIVIDWHFNREVRSVIRTRLAKIAAD
jgi:hypothetical protein